MSRIKVLYFAALREAMGTAQEEVTLPAGVATVAELRAHLAGRGDRFAALATAKNLRAAVNRHLADASAAVSDGDEVAFFPPVTGG